jgi:hypothetical protein
MSLVFLYPLALLGALAVGVPLWLHLQRRFYGSVVRFSAMRFLTDEPLARRAPLRLKDPLLFALRALAIVLLAAAFAWPYDPTDTAAPSLESRVYFLDNTLSHQAGGAFESHRDRLADDIANAASTTQTAVVELTTQPRIVVPFDQDHTAASQVIRGLKPTSERGSYAAALRLADTLLRSSVGDDRRLIVYSDQQANQYEELLQSPQFFEGAKIDWADSPLRDQPNLALARPQLRRLLAGSRSLLELTLELYHQGDIPRASIHVTSNGKPTFDRTIELKDAPDRIVVTVRWDEERDVAVRGEAVVEGSPDSLAADNRVYFALPPVRRGRVALAAKSIFLKAAFAPDVMQEAWKAESVEPANASDVPGRGGLADVLCLESHYIRESTAATRLLRSYLDSGRGAFVVLDDASPEVIETLDELGFTIDPKPVVAADPRPLGFVQRSHPIFQPFSSPDFGNLNDVHFSRHNTVQSKTATPLMFSDTGAPLLFEAGNQKLLLATFPVERDATDWPLKSTFVPFLDLCLQRLRGEQQMPANLLPREVAVFHLPSESKSRQFVLTDDETELDRGPIDNRRVQVTAPAIPGVYVLKFDSPDDDALWLAVNPPPPESELKYIDPAKVAASIMQPEATQGSAAQPAARDLTKAEILQQRLWWVILLIGIGAVFGENIWLAVRGRAA